MKSLVLAEKPSVGKTLAEALKCHKKTKSYYEGNRYIVTWAMGHLVTLAEPHAYNARLKEWHMEDLPMLPEKMKLKVMKRTSFQFNSIKKLMGRNDVNEIIIATDAGREGELVARWIMKLAGCRKPFKRLWISSQTESAIKEGFSNLKPGNSYNNLYKAAVCRAEADWLIGLNVTRALTCKFNSQLSAGRVQTPTLSMIVDREKEIENFNPVNYWTIKVDFGEFVGYWRNEKGDGRIFDEERANALAEKLETQSAIIENVKTETKSEQPPLAYDLTELQRDANRRYGFSAKQTLSIVQSLYEYHKVATYPRTDSRYITTDMVPTLNSRLSAVNVPPYSNMVKPLLDKKLNPGKRFVNNARVSDHHAIIPTEQRLNLSKLDSEEKKVFDLIVKRFVAVLYPPFKYDQTTLITKIGNERFHSKGKIVRDEGWKSVTQYTGEKGSTGDFPEQKLKSHRKGEEKKVKKVYVERSKTRPPSRYTEATLLTAMESPGKFIEDEELRESIKAGGLGTPATRAEIIEKLLSSFYVERHGKDLVPTSKGKQLIGLVPEELKSPELTAKWELRLSDISKGRENDRKFLADMRTNAKRLVTEVKSSDAHFEADNLTSNLCPICGKKMLLFRGKKGQTLVCSDPACGYRQSMRDAKSDGFKRSKKESYMNKRLINQYSDKADGNRSLGDLLKSALEDNQEK